MSWGDATAQAGVLMSIGVGGLLFTIVGVKAICWLLDRRRDRIYRARRFKAP